MPDMVDNLQVNLIEKNWRDVGVRALKTFGQSSIAAFIVLGLAEGGGEQAVTLESLRAVLFGGVAAGLSVLQNALLPNPKN